MSAGSGVGIKMRRMLDTMGRVGKGCWPATWVLQTQDKDVMARLHDRGLVTRPDHRAVLTDAGWEWVRP